MVPIIESLKFLAIQNLALRGHRDDGPIYFVKEEDHEEFDGFAYPEENDGNFRQLLQFRVKSGDEVLRNHLKTSQSSNYTSKSVQNALLSDMGALLKESIVEDIKKSPCWSLLADETTDCSHKEQLVITARYLFNVL